MESIEKNACSNITCAFNVRGQCPAVDVLRDPRRETGCVYYKNKNVQIDNTKNE